MNLDNYYKDFNDFMADFKTNPIYKDLILRYRKDDKQLIYYDGNEIVTINKNILSFPINTYKCNYTELKNKIANSDNRKEAFKSFRNIRQNVCGEAGSLFDFTMNGITFKSKSEIIGTREYKKFCDILKKREIKYGFTFEDSKEKSYKYNNEFKFTNYNCDDAKSKARRIILVQYEFLKIFMFDNNNKLGIKGVEYKDFKATYRKNRQKDELATFFETMKNAIKKYEGKEELEKKYQHSFMLSKNILNIFGDSKGLYYFEQEYGIINKKRKVDKNGKKEYKKGRIDAIFYRVKDNILTNIYLVELKVDDKVISNESGVLTHIDDINYFLTDKDQISNLKNYIKDRYLDYEGNESLDTSNTDISFCTVIAFTQETELIKGLRTLRKVLNNGDPKGPDYLDGKNINSLDEEHKYKFYYQKELWNQKCISGEFKLINLEEVLGENISIEDYING